MDNEGFSNYIVKNICLTIVDVLTYLINLSFETGTVPNNLKHAIVIPLLKKGDSTIQENYRPISLLPIFSKILEKAMKNRMINFLNEFAFFNKSQFGFREGLSTEKALVEFLNGVYDSINNNVMPSSLFIDIKKAFDMVDHSILLNKLYCAGFRGISHRWFESYLSNRQQSVKIGDNKSGPRCLKIGVPQGSILGPLFFIIYINSFFKLPLNGKAIAFADDIALTYHIKCRVETVKLINDDLLQISSWFKSHYMLLSEKSKLMFFKYSDSCNVSIPKVEYHFNCKNSIGCTENCLEIDHINEFKYLGLILDSNLEWKAHIKNVSDYLSCVLRKIYLLRNVCPRQVLRNVYFSLVQSKIEYGLVCWGGIYESTLDRIIKLQKWIVKVMFFKSRRSSSWSIFVKNCMLPLRHLFFYKVLRLFFCRSGDKGFKNMVQYNFRSNSLCLYDVPRSRKELFRRCFVSLAPLIFNQLPLNIRKCYKLRDFLNNVKEWLFHIPDAESLLKPLS